MKKTLLIAVLLIAVLFTVPLFLLREEPPAEIPNLTGIAQLDSAITLNVQLYGVVQEMDLNRYLWGVVAAEMPASFEIEALKAQAVAARTYALQRSQYENPNHPEAHICDDHRCCQAYISPEEAVQNWGSDATLYTDKILEAVSYTNQEVMLYDGGLISAVFHSSSDGRTQNSVEVWGGDMPYLVSVESPEGEGVPDYHSAVSFTPDEFRNTFLSAYPDAVLQGEPDSWFLAPTLSSSGSVLSISVGGVSVEGGDLRSLLGLRSTNFTVESSADEITFSVTGYGHGVGMSQYGANSMAADGFGYLDILTWYYSGVTIAPAPAEFLSFS